MRSSPALLLLILATGCAAPRTPYPASLNSERPDERVNAVRHAAHVKDRSVIPILVERLEDEDDAVRFYAILALERLTGTRLGYSYHASESQRGRAVERWRRQISGGGPTTQQASRDEAEK